MSKLRNRIRLTPNFWLNEFEDKHAYRGSSNDPGHSDFKDAPPQRAGLVTVEAMLVFQLEALRVRVNRRINIHSGFRTAETNKIVGGATRSRHLTGEGADVSAEGMTPDELGTEAKDFFSFVKVYATHVHVDVR